MSDQTNKADIAQDELQRQQRLQQQRQQLQQQEQAEQQRSQQQKVEGVSLSVAELVSGYGKKQVLNRVALEVRQGEIVALIGHNGAGKSTLLKAVFGLIPIWSGEVYLNSTVWPKPTPRDLLHAGVAYVPQGNRVFSDLTVYENLEMGGTTLPGKQALNEGIERALTLFPGLKPRLKQRAGTLSGGEKQMLALANALILSPRLLLLDEPSLGLAPPLVTEAIHQIKAISQGQGVTILIVEQKVREVLKISHRVYVLRNGKISFQGQAQELNNDSKLREVYL